MRFGLKYQAAGGDGQDAAATEEQPVLIHRAVLGSVERMTAILTEHYAGKWPFFLSPRQCLLVPVSKVYTDYALQVQKELHEAGFYVDVDSSARTLNKMVREAQVTQYNFILVVGEAEMNTHSVKMRARDTSEGVDRKVSELIAEFK